jgi:hypothetical protein
MVSKSRYILEAPNVGAINCKIRELQDMGYQVEGDIKVFYYGQKDYEKIYVQTMVSVRTWREYFRSISCRIGAA